MKRTVLFYFRSLILLSAFLIPCKDTYANHILGMDLNYTWLHDSTYQISLVAYGDCGNASFASLETATPTICIYNGNTSIGNITLALSAPTTGTEITPVCVADIGMTTCTSTTLTIPGVKKFVYTGNYTLPSRSAVWRFVFNGTMGGSSAGRASTITNINNPGSSIIQLIDTLNASNLTIENSSPNLTVIPTPYYCLNNNDNYNPGATDVNGDSLQFMLVAGKSGNAGSCTISNTTVTYNTGYSATAPLSTNAGTFSFDSRTGQIAFNPNIAQRSLVVYNVREFRSGVLVGTSQREMSFLVQTCSNSPANGPISAVTNGTAIDSTHFRICQNTGAYSFNVNPTEANPANRIKITASGLPTGSTFVVTGDSTATPQGLFSWTSNGVTSGTYSFVLNFVDNSCPIGSSNSVAYNITVAPTPAITGPTVVCAQSTITLSNTSTGGTWTSGNLAVTTVVAATGVVTGINTGTTPVTGTINYSSAAGCVAPAYTVTVNPQPAVISGNTSVCVGSTTILSDATAGGTWASGTLSVATVVTGPAASTTVTGVSGPGTSVITYKLPVTGCARTTTVTVNPPPGAITGGTTVCVGSTINLSDATSGGTWSTSNGNATVSVTGAVTGQTTGSVVISYTTGSGCSKTSTVTVTAAPPAITPATSSICIGTTLTLSDATTGGVWTSSTSSVATINNATRVVTGVSVGATNITYTIGSCFVAETINVNTSPGAISPNPATVCTGLTVTLSEATTGGAWSSSNTARATVVSGVVTGVSNGAVTISYSVGTCTATSTVNVNTSPAAITPASAVSICINTIAALSDVTGGGVWSSSSNALATVSPTGAVTGVAPGTPTITYTSGGCFVTKAVTVNSTPTAILPASASVCVGATKILSDAVTGGAWSISNTAATINSVTGAATGAVAGSATVTYSIGSCTITALLTVNPLANAGTITGPTVVCSGGTTITLSDVPGGGVWSSGSPSLATITAGGVVTGVSSGTDIISYSVTNGCGTQVATYSISVNSTMGAGVIIGPSTICAGTSTNLAETVAGGTWTLSTGNASVTSGGLLSGLSAGPEVVSYTVTNTCGTYIATQSIPIGAFLTAGTIIGSPVICMGVSITFSDATPGGVWSSTSPSVATISGLGVVTGLSAGSTTISYLEISSCGSIATTLSMTVNPTPVAGPIVGPSTICEGTFSFLSDAAAGGVWSSSNTSAATVDATGLLNGVSAGSTTISYVVTNSCGSIGTSLPLTVSPAPSVASISGASFVCAGNTISLTDATAGGVWSSSNASATISATGLVTGVSAGTDTIIYSITIACGTITTTKPITVNPALTAGAITGPTNVCVSSLITLSDAVLTGAWSSGNAHATITAGGVLTGITPGIDTISYSVFNSCGIATATRVISVTPSSDAGTITGNTTICPGGTSSLSDIFTGGIWASTNTAIAVVSATGVVTGRSIGTDTVFYTLVSSCGSNVSFVPITISSVPAITAITGPSTVCIGASITLADATSGGVWSASNGHATVSGGSVNAVSVGPDVISYSVTNSCGTAVATQTVTVVSFPTVTLISGPSSVCVAASITLLDATAGGVWSSTNTNNAIVNSAGVVTGVAAGSDLITYLVTNACGTVGTSKFITINPLADPGTITGPDSVCVGSTILLQDLTPGGAWRSGNVNATVVGGTVTGVAAGTVPISYSMTNGCGTVSAVQIVTVVSPPNAGTITGPSSVCVGSGITLLDAAPGGTWLSSNANAVILAPGIVDGAITGTDTIFYLVNNACGAAFVSHIITVNPIPFVAPITGPTSQCAGTVITVSDITPSGQWSSSNPSIAAISLLTGVTNGVSAGIVNLTYTVTNGFGCPASATYPDTVNIVPPLLPITGSSTVCVGSIAQLSDATAGGTWSSTNNLIATVDAAGNVTGVAAGSAGLSYYVVNACGATLMTTTITVNPLPVIAAISGTTSICAGTTSTFSDITPGGAWSSTNTTIAVIDPALGTMTGVNAGTVNIDYTLTTALGCSAAAITSATVNGIPVVSAITGTAGVCSGLVSALSDVDPGGMWSSDNTSVATVDASGNVTGVSGGTVTISYSVAGGAGCIGAATVPFVVSTVPAPSFTTGNNTICVGQNTTLSNAMAGGVWGSVTGLATVSPVGMVTGLGSGTGYIIYTVFNACGAAYDSTLITINALPVVSTISAPATAVCAGTAIAMSDATTGGVWSSSNTVLATVSNTGVVTGVSQGIVTIMYSVSNGSGCTNTSGLLVSVGPVMPSVTVSPLVSATLCHGNPVLMQANASGGTGITYQWLMGGSSIPGATAATYTTNTPGNFSVTISNGVCSETLSGPVVVGQPDPVISFDPPNVLYTASFTSYQWYLNGIAIPGDTTSIIFENGPGYYTVVATDQNGCSDTSSAYATLGINNVNPAQNIKVYPNPATALLHIDAPVKVNVSVLSIDGKLLISQKDAVNIDVHNLANGMYLIMIYDENNVFLQTTKFAKNE